MINGGKMDKKEKLIKTAIKLFVKQGFENTPTSQISKEAGVASGTLFYHFNTKEELISEAYMYAKKRIWEDISKDFNKEDTYKETLRKVWYNVLKWGLKHKTENDFCEKFRNSIYISNVKKEEINSLFKDIKIIIFDKPIENGLIKDMPFETYVEIIAALNQVFLNEFSKKKIIDDKLLVKSFEVLWDAVKK